MKYALLLLSLICLAHPVLAQTQTTAPSLTNALNWTQQPDGSYSAAIAPADLKARDTAQTHHLVRHIFNYYGYNLDGTGPGKKQNPITAIMTVPPADQQIVAQFIQQNMADLQKGKLKINYQPADSQFVISANSAAKTMVEKILTQAQTAFAAPQ